MVTKSIWAIAALAPLGLSTLASAQQPAYPGSQPYQPAPAYQPPPSYQAPPPAYQQPPPSYQAPPAQNYQAPPPQNYQAPPSYSQPAPSSQAPRSYPPQQGYPPAAPYQQAPAANQPYSQAPAYPQAPQQAPAGAQAPATNYGAPPPSGYAPAAGYPQNPSAYSPPRQYPQQPAAAGYGYGVPGYQAPPGAAPGYAAGPGAAAGAATGVAAGAAAAGSYQQPGAYAPGGYQQGAGPYQQLPNYSPSAGAAAPLAAGAAAQQASQPRPTAGPQTTQFSSDELLDPYPKHEDTRFGHDHVYPNRGAMIRDPPHTAIAVNYAGLSYKFYEGVWYEPRGPAFIVVEPPIGLVVPALPAFATPVTSGDTTYLYANSTFYHARPDLGGYEVVNDPSEAMPITAAAPPTSAAFPAAAAMAVPVVTASAMAAPAAAPAAYAPSAAVQGTRPPGTSFTVYPKNNQTTDEQARDYFECYRFANSQTGYDPRNPGINSMRQPSYERAEAACFDARGYVVR